MKFIEREYVVVKVSAKRWQVAESWLDSPVGYKGATVKHYNVVGPRFADWRPAHEHAMSLAAAQTDAINLATAVGYTVKVIK